MNRPARWKQWGLAAIGIAALAFILAWGPIHQPRSYHDFADGRPLGAIPNFLNVASNLPFFAVGILGLAFLCRPSALSHFKESWEKGPWGIFMASFLLVGLGSTAYHWRPTDGTLLWDRLPLALLLGSFVGVIILDRLSAVWGRRLFLPLIALALLSVLYWHWTNGDGRGDLRFYVLFQGGAMLFVPLVVVLFPSRYSGTGAIAAAALLYGLAKICEWQDASIYSLGHVASGHTLKHLLAGLAGGLILAMLRKRRSRTPSGNPSSENLVALRGCD
jgi:hypothetical protein